ncbi:MAG: hypothetical protein Kow0068_04040 [Marinilabiliales bacterium]
MFKNYYTDTKSQLDYLSENIEVVDSLIENMPIEEKLGNLVLCSFPEIQSVDEIIRIIKNVKIGAIEFQCTNRVLQNEFISIINKAKSYPFLSTNKNYYPSFIDDKVHFPGLPAIENIVEDSLIFKFLRINVDNLKSSGYNIVYFNENFPGNQLRIDTLLSITKRNNLLSCYKPEINEKLFKANLNKSSKKIKHLIDNGLMIIFLNKDFYIDDNNQVLLSKYLVDSLNFNGLIINKFDKESFGENFLKSSTDILFVEKESLPWIIDSLKQLYINNLLLIDDINNKLKKTLHAKLWSNKSNLIPNKQNDLIIKKQISLQLHNNSIVLARNDNNYIPVINVNNPVIVYNIGDKMNDFNEQLKLYVQPQIIYISADSTAVEKISFPAKYHDVIITLKNTNNNEEIYKFINKNTNWFKGDRNIVIVNFDSAEILGFFSDCPTIIQVPCYDSIYEKLAAQAIYGGIDIKGKFSRKYFDNYKYLTTEKIRLGYTIPEEFGMNQDSISIIDSIAIEGITSGAFPGCQVLVAKSGKVIYSKSFGYQTYAKKYPVQGDNLYDLASVTKIVGTTIAVMKMFDQGKLDLKKPIEEYYKDTHIEYTKIKPDTIVNIDTLNVDDIEDFDEFLKSVNDTINLNDSLFIAYDTIILKVTPELNIFKCCIYDMLIHKSGIPPSMPILRYLQFSSDSVITLPDTFKITEDSNLVVNELKNYSDTNRYLYIKYFNPYYIKGEAETEIAENMYFRKAYEDTFWIDCKQSVVYAKDVYMYSDFNMNLIQRTIDTINGYSISRYLYDYFYKPLGCRTICYKPLKFFPRYKIVPTENDIFWRHQVLRGHVHDPTAALLGGIAGNAGLFSNANDLAIICQMLLNSGKYGGIRYLNENTVRFFTSMQPGSFRALGFDMVSPENLNAKDAPQTTYGHTGYTGTCVWIDPENDIIFIFLSNRNHPDNKNWQLLGLKIIQRMHQAIYNSM